ncbi:hypothetical protein BC939DRAFT_456197, partial [Gamsiella multidivaricata]|uniref:uncharacterized protein n=1 Tax=Gamsiella multidivaricata TaxID=101098 RepID=UPI00222066D8
MQPVFRYRRWLEKEKNSKEGNQPESISEMESRFPLLRGPGASITKYWEALELKKKGPEDDDEEEESKCPAGERLLEFYAGSNNRFKKHGWDWDRAKQAEYQAIAASLLGIVGGSIGHPRDPANPVLIGVGLGQFKSTGRISSLHSTFLDYFIPLARSLGYIVVGLNEYYTSKKCP